MAWRVALATIGIGALALRLLHLFDLRGTPLVAVLIGDGRQYDVWAQQIAGGSWMGTDVFYQTPLYPYLLAVIFKLLGHHALAVRGLQAMGGAASCVLLGIAGRAFFSERVGLIAAGLLAIYPPAIFFDGLIQKSSLDVFLVTLLLVCLGAFQQRPSTVSLVSAGAVLGALTLNRENARVLYPIIVLWLLVMLRQSPRSRRWINAGIFTASVAVVLVPVAARNFLVGGAWLISTSQLGSNLYIGNHTGASGVYDELVPGHGNASYERTDATRLAEDAAGRTLSPSEVSSYWVGRTIDEVRRHPSRWLTLMGRKLVLTFHASEVADTESIEAYADYSRVLRWLRWITFGVILPLAVVGAVHTRADWRRLALLHAMCLGLAASIAAFYVLGRYRYPLVPIAILFASAAIAAIPELWRQRRRLTVAAAIAAGVAAGSNYPVAAAPDGTYVNVASALITDGKPQDAILLLTRAIQITPNDPALRFQLGVAFQRVQNPSSALQQFAEVVRLRPDFAEGQDSLALTEMEVGRDAEALPHFREAARLGPNSAGAHSNLAIALQQHGELAEAIKEYIAALKLNPDNASAENNLALALAATGQTDDAIGHFHQAIRVQPATAEFHINLADLLLASGRTSPAIEEYEQAVTLSPGLAEGQYRLAKAYASVGRVSDAVTALEHALNIARAAGQADEVQQITETLRVLRGRIRRLSQ